MKQGIRVEELRRRISGEIRKERRAKIASRDGTMRNSGDFFLGRIAALIALGKAYPKIRVFAFLVLAWTLGGCAGVQRYDSTHERIYSGSYDRQTETSYFGLTIIPKGFSK